MSREVERRIAERITPPFVDPYGNPIPGLRELGVTLAGGEEQVTPEGQERAKAIADLAGVVADGARAEVRIERIGEVLQSDPGQLGELADHGIVPGAVVDVDRVADSFVLRGPAGGEIGVPLVVAGQLRVTMITRG